MVVYGVYSLVNKGNIFIGSDFFFLYMLCYNAVSCQWMNEHGAVVEWYWQEDWSAHRNTWMALCLPHVPHWLLQWEAGSWLPKPWHIFVSCKHTVHLVVCMYQNWPWTCSNGTAGTGFIWLSKGWPVAGYFELGNPLVGSMRCREFLDCVHRRVFSPWNE